MAETPANKVEDPYPPGSQFDGRYRVIRKLGAGGFGAVYLMEQTQIKGMLWKVAVKVLHKTDAGALDQSRERFIREMLLVRELEHPNCVPIREVGSFDGRLYFTMDYVEGKPLSKVLESSGGIEPARLVAWGIQILDFLEYLHGKDYIHRDLKPDNLMLVGEGDQEKIRVLDLGIAKATNLDEDEIALTGGMVIGTPRYMSPEHWLGHEPDRRFDLFALGVVLYEGACGKHPYLDGGSKDLRRRVIAGACTPLRELVPQIPEWLESVIRKAMAPVETRFESAAEFRQALVAQQVLVDPTNLAVAAEATLEVATKETIDILPPEPAVPEPIDAGDTDKKFPWGIMAGVIGVVVLCVCGYIFMKADSNVIPDEKSEDIARGAAVQTESAQDDFSEQQQIAKVAIAESESAVATKRNEGPDDPSPEMDSEARDVESSKLSTDAQASDLKQAALNSVPNSLTAGNRPQDSSPPLAVSVRLDEDSESLAGESQWLDLPENVESNSDAEQVIDPSKAAVGTANALACLTSGPSEGSFVLPLVEVYAQANLDLSPETTIDGQPANVQGREARFMLALDAGEKREVAVRLVGLNGAEFAFTKTLAAAKIPAGLELTESSKVDSWGYGLVTPLRDSVSGLVFCLIPSTEVILGQEGFLMGAIEGDRQAEKREKPQVRVRITKPFYMGQATVTWEQWERVDLRNESVPTLRKPNWTKGLPDEGQLHPVTLVAPEEALAFCKATGTRLPTEAEWSWACRHDAPNSLYLWGSEFEEGKDRTNVYDLSRARSRGPVDGSLNSFDGFEYSAPAQALVESSLGLFHLSGNVLQFCADTFSENTFEAWSDSEFVSDPISEDPTAPGLVARGSSFKLAQADIRLSRRTLMRWGRRYDDCGFRVVFEIPGY